MAEVPVAAFEKLVRSAQADQRLPGVVAAVVHGDEIVWQGAAGVARPGAAKDRVASRIAQEGPAASASPAAVSAGRSGWCARRPLPSCA